METRKLNSKIGGIPSKDLSRYFPGVHLDLFEFLFRTEPTIQLTRIPFISDISNIQIEPELKQESSPVSPEKSHSPSIPPSSNILIEEIDLKTVQVKPEPALNTIGEQNIFYEEDLSESENHEEMSEKDSRSQIKTLFPPQIKCESELIDKKVKSSKKKSKPQSTVCPHCYKEFKTHVEVIRHTKYAHKCPTSETHTFICDQCPRRFRKSDQLVFHQFEHKLPNFLKDYHDGRCSICKKQSFIANPKKRDNHKLQILRGHILSHEGLGKNARCSFQGCGKILPVKRLKAHEALHEKRVKMEACTECGQEFQFKGMLKNHRKSRHGPIKCKYRYCPLTFANEALRLKHAQIHEDDFDSTNLCPHCGKIFRRNIYLRNHLRTHEGMEKVKCTHDGCGKFITKEFLKIHIRRMHLPEDQIQKYICEICGAIYKSQSNFTNHREIKHLNKYACPLPNCGILNQSKLGLEIHLKAHKNKEEFQAKIKESDGPKYACEKCDKVYSQSQSLRYHERTFHAKTKLTCPVQGCGKEFALKRYLDQHQMSHDGERVKCKFCERFYAKINLQFHIIKTHKKERDLQYKCTFCGDSFVREKILKIHIEKSHPNGEKIL